MKDCQDSLASLNWFILIVPPLHEPGENHTVLESVSASLPPTLGPCLKLLGSAGSDQYHFKN